MKKNNIFLIICVSILSLITVAMLIFPLNSASSYYNVDLSDISEEELSKQDIIVQKIKIKSEKLNSIGIKLSSNAQNKSKIVVEILGLDDDFKTIINASEFIYDNFYNIKIPEQKNIKNKEISLKIYYQNYEQDSVLTYKYTTKNNNYKIIKNNKNKSGTLLVNINGYDKDKSLIWYPLILLSICITMLTIDGGKKNEKK